MRINSVRIKLEERNESFLSFGALSMYCMCIVKIEIIFKLSENYVSIISLTAKINTKILTDIVKSLGFNFFVILVILRA